eukprot:scaffold224355_cov22-Tisochrysis_lutea.AAC.2
MLTTGAYSITLLACGTKGYALCPAAMPHLQPVPTGAGRKELQWKCITHLRCRLAASKNQSLNFCGPSTPWRGRRESTKSCTGGSTHAYTRPLLPHLTA